MSDLVPPADMHCPAHLLEEGEKAIWWDRPDPKRYALRGTMLRIPLALIFTVISASTLYDTAKSSNYTWIVGVVFICIGLWMLSEPLRKYREALSTHYLLTDTRAVIASKSARLSYSLLMMPALEIDISGDGKGDVIFSRELVDDGDGGKKLVRDGFIGIPDADKVMREMRRLQALA